MKTGWPAWSKKVPMYMEKCPGPTLALRCKDGKCPKCKGSGYVPHECKVDMNREIIRVWDPKWSSCRETLIRCTICGAYYMSYADIDPGAGNSYFTLGVGETYGYRTFTQEELDKLLAEVT